MNTQDRSRLGRRNKRRGAFLERKTKKRLEAIGYLVIKSGASLGLFDLVAMQALTQGPNWRLIQVKANRCPRKEIEDIKVFKVPFFTHKEVWIWKDRAREPEIYIY